MILAHSSVLHDALCDVTDLSRGKQNGRAMNRAIPNINTSRLALRALRPEDFDRYAEIWATPDAVHSLAGAERNRRAAWEAFLRNAGHWQMTGFGQWAVVEQRSRELIGEIGFFYGTQSVDAELDSLPEVGWLLVPEAQGNGLAVEAARAAHDWFDRVIPSKLMVRVPAVEKRSLDLAEMLGYAPVREMDHGAQAVIVMRRDGPSGRR